MPGVPDLPLLPRSPLGPTGPGMPGRPMGPGRPSRPGGPGGPAAPGGQVAQEPPGGGKWTRERVWRAFLVSVRIVFMRERRTKHTYQVKDNQMTRISFEPQKKVLTRPFSTRTEKTYESNSQSAETTVRMTYQTALLRLWAFCSIPARIHS